jgi:hypothetical protein
MEKLDGFYKIIDQFSLKIDPEAIFQEAEE